MTSTSNRPDWGKLFWQMLEQPGKQAEYYGLFHRYSLGNQALAIVQMEERGIPVGPISSFNGWKKLGRRVKKGEKALALWMPVVKTEEVEKEDGTRESRTRQFFIMKNFWFALAQTEPINPDAEVINVVVEAPDWDKPRALETLGITEVPFDHVDGNVQGYARPESAVIAINPVAAMPWKTIFHELAHCLLHTNEAMKSDGATLDRGIEEAEAEAVAYLCCACLGLPGLDESRWYVQDWLGSIERREEFKKSASRVFAAADRILKAGSTTVSKEEVEHG